MFCFREPPLTIKAFLRQTRPMLTILQWICAGRHGSEDQARGATGQSLQSVGDAGKLCVSSFSAGPSYGAQTHE